MEPLSKTSKMLLSLLLSLEFPLLKQLKRYFIEEMNYVHVNTEKSSVFNRRMLIKYPKLRSLLRLTTVPSCGVVNLHHYFYS